ARIAPAAVRALHRPHAVPAAPVRRGDDGAERRVPLHGGRRGSGTRAFARGVGARALSVQHARLGVEDPGTLAQAVAVLPRAPLLTAGVPLAGRSLADPVLELGAALD